MRIVLASAIVVLIASSLAHSQPASACGDIARVFESLPGDWVGTVLQSTDGKLGDKKYFHAVTKQLGSDTYETVFTYFRLDGTGGALVPAGVSSIETKIDAVGTATNCMTGKGDILVAVNSWKPESHEMTEVLRASPTGELQGTGSGSISVVGMPLGCGKNGKVQSYSSTWSVSNDVLKISQRFNVEFRLLLFCKSVLITADYTAKRGSDILGLMKAAVPQPTKAG